MKKISLLLPLLALSSTTEASEIRGALGNFDALNHTGDVIYGIEIELDDCRSKDVVGTYPGNHYGSGKIREDLSDTLHPKVFVRYDAPAINGTYGFTNPVTTANPSCYDLTKNMGCEHFGVRFGYVAGRTTPPYSAVKYNWLIKDASGKVVVGPALQLSLPSFSFTPPTSTLPAQVVATIPAPLVQQPIVKEFGNPSWVKVIKTTTHRARQLALADLISEDHDADGLADWTNGEPDEVESEWRLLQPRNGGTGGNSELEGGADTMGANAEEAVTRRYEFYSYVGPADSIDGESGEAMCDGVAEDNQSGVGIKTVSELGGGSHEFDCATAIVVGAYQGSQMTEFLASTPFAMTDVLQNGKVNVVFPQLPTVSGGNTPYVTNVSAGVLPNGLSLESATGLLSGVPSKVGVFNFTVAANDAANITASKAFTVKVTGPGDTDGDSDIDMNDLNAIRTKYGQTVPANDPRDLNGDLRVNFIDYRKAASLCTLPQCTVINSAP